MEPKVLIIQPNTPTLLVPTEAFAANLAELLGVSAVSHSRVIVQDENDFGIILPATLLENKSMEFVLPEQLCIFNPNKTYIVKAEVVFEDQLVTPFLGQCRIDLGGLTEPDEQPDEQTPVQDLESTPEPLNESKDDFELDGILDLIAPVPVHVEQKKTKLEEIAKVLDQEFVKQVLFTSPQQKQTKALKPETVSELSAEKLALKHRMKSVLKGMIGV
jgi:hypothetical protein